jgi:prevent-host-death family protein
MLDLKNIRPVTDFNRNTKESIDRLKATGKPEILTVNGSAEIVVQSAEGYQKLMEAADRAEILEGISRGLDQVKRGEVRPMREFLEELAAKNNIPLK